MRCPFFFLTTNLICAQESAEKPTCEFFERYGDWPEDLKIPGTLLVTDSVSGFKHYVEQVGGLKAKYKEWILVGPWKSVESILVGDQAESLSKSVKKISWVPKFDAIESIDPEACLFICDDRSIEEIPPQEWQAMGNSMRDHLSKGAVVGFVGPACTGLGKSYPLAKSENRLNQGLGLFPDAILCFTSDGDCDTTVCQTVPPKDPSVVLSISKDNAWMLQGRKGMLFGPGAATVWIGPSKHTDQATQRIEARSQRNSNRPENFLLDWTQWRRLAIERTLEAFPPTERQKPLVNNGSLIIVGGGGMPSGLMQKFVDLAGGSEARIVYVPCAEEEDMSNDTRLLEVWKQMGAKKCSLMHTKDRRVADRDDPFLEPLKDATGIWFGGGRQWNLADSYYGTQAHRLMKQVLDRGGVIGGSSAGASIQASYLARATPIENFRIMAPGYERGGLGFISGVAIDQHFTQRRRQKDLISLVETYPQLLGIGIDETTAIVVKKSMAEIVGPGRVTFNWKNEPATQVQEFVGSEGQRFDLANRVEIQTE